MRQYANLVAEFEKMGVVMDYVVGTRPGSLWESWNSDKMGESFIVQINLPEGADKRLCWWFAWKRFYEFHWNSTGGVRILDPFIRDARRERVCIRTMKAEFRMSDAAFYKQRKMIRFSSAFEWKDWDGVEKRLQEDHQHERRSR